MTSAQRDAQIDLAQPNEQEKEHINDSLKQNLAYVDEALSEASEYEELYFSDYSI